MSRSLPLVLLGFGGIAAAVVAATMLRPSDAGDRADAEEVTALRSQVEDLRREVEALRELTGSMGVAAAAAPVREVAPAAMEPESATFPNGSAAAAVAPADREAILAVIREERDMREREREEQQRKQQRERTTQRVKSSAERVGIDPTTTESLVKVYMTSLDREDDVRRAYPIADIGDPNLEKRRLELQAAWSDRDARVAALLPPDKKEQWDRQTRWLDRGRDFPDDVMGGLERIRNLRQRDRREGGSNPAGEDR